jgi:hypothetical protein
MMIPPINDFEWKKRARPNDDIEWVELEPD